MVDDQSKQYVQTPCLHSVADSPLNSPLKPNPSFLTMWRPGMYPRTRGL